MDVVVSGASGLIGSALSDALARSGHHVVRLVRRPPADPDEVGWDPSAAEVDTSALERAVGDHWAVVHLSGRPIAPRRWSAKLREELRRSRIDSTAVLADAVAAMARPPAAFLGASAVGIYGERGDEVLTEESTLGAGFLAELCRDWEAAAKPAEGAGVRVVSLRTGLVLSREGGLLPVLLRPFRLGVGGRMGSGRQWMSWISVDDQVGAIVHLLGADSVSGPVNLTAPSPVTNAELAATLGRVLHRPALVPLPAVAFKLLMGSETAHETALASQRALPTRLEDSGYVFEHRELEPALHDVLAR